MSDRQYMQDQNSYQSEEIVMVGTDTPGPIVERIRDSLLDHGIARHKVRREIMDITGVSKQNLTHWFNGNTLYPSIESIIQISKAFNLDIEWLVMGEKKNTDNAVISEGGSPVNIGHADSVIVNGGMLSE